MLASALPGEELALLLKLSKGMQVCVVTVLEAVWFLRIPHLPVVCQVNLTTWVSPGGCLCALILKPC